MKLCSVIMPTRSANHDSLRKAVRSILDAPGTNKSDVEILLRLDDDDPERFFVAEELTKGGQGSYVIGPRHNGYTSMGLFTDDLLKICDSRWVWLVDDDAWVEGDWYTPLYWMPVDCAVNAQYYCLGGSRYNNGPEGGAVGILIPAELAKSAKGNNPVDDQWLSMALQRGWKVKQLPNVEYHHCGRPR